MQDSDNRLTMDLTNVSKTIWSTTTSPTLSPAFRNSFKLSMHDTGNDVEKFPKRPTLPSPLETNLNPSLMHPSQTTSQARFLHLSRRTTQALHRATLPHPRKPLPTFHRTWVKIVNWCLMLWCCSVHCTTQPGAERGSDVGFSSCAFPNYLVLMSKYFRCVLGIPRIPVVSGEVWEFGSKSRTGVLSRERGV